MNTCSYNVISLKKHAATFADFVRLPFTLRRYIDRLVRFVMLAKLRFSTIQAGLVLFWAIWLSLVTLTNIADAMKQIGALPNDFKLASYNFALVKKAVEAHGVPTTVTIVLFVGIIVWELLASFLFWRAWEVMRCNGKGAAQEVAQAFAVSLALWAAFLIATEVTVAYETAATHKQH